MIKAVLFDFDGTLANSSKGIFSTALKVVHDMGYDRNWPENQLRKFIGPPLKDCFRIAFNLKEEELDDAVYRYRDIYNKTGYLECALYDGIKELLIILKKRGLLIGAASNKEQSTLERCIENLGLASYFDGIFGTDIAGYLKKADVIRRGIQEFSLLPNEVVMVGDTENDRLGALESEVNFIGVTWGFGYTIPCLSDGVYYVSNPSDVIKVMDMEVNMIEKIETKNAPAAIGPYSQAVKVGGFVFASGQIPVDPATGKVVEGSTADQAKQCFKNIKAVLAEAGTDMSKVVKATVFLKDMNDFVPVNEVYAEAFSSSAVLPARSAVQVAKLPKDVGVEIEVIAII